MDEEFVTCEQRGGHCRCYNYRGGCCDCPAVHPDAPRCARCKKRWRGPGLCGPCELAARDEAIAALRGALADLLATLPACARCGRRATRWDDANEPPDGRCTAHAEHHPDAHDASAIETAERLLDAVSR